MRLPKFFGRRKKLKENTFYSSGYRAVRWPVLIRRVSGDSMLPSYRPGQLIVAVRRSAYKPGDAVLLCHDGLEKLKRIAAIHEQGKSVYVVGDNPARSTDSRHFGPIAHGAIRGKVMWPRSISTGRFFR